MLLVRGKGWPKNFFALCTGYLEAQDESPMAAILREVKEELSIDIAVKELIGVYEFKEKNELMIVYLVAPLVKDQKVRLSEELEDWKLVPISKLKPWRYGTGKAVADYLKKKFTPSKL